jgi:hypothetical protein
MKRLIALCVCLLMVAAVPASADLMGTVTQGNLTVGATVDTSNTAYNVVDVWLESLTGPLVGSECSELSGRWTAVGGTMKVDPAAATTSAFKKQTVLSTGGGTYSGINFHNYVGAFGRDGLNTSNQSSYLYCDEWYSDGGDPTSELYPVSAVGKDTLNGDGQYPESLIGEFLVTKATTAISFTNLLDGQISTGFTYDYNSGTTQNTVFSISLVPEPSTFALLGCGLFGLLAYAWRKRK